MGETIQTAALRETREEIGVQANIKDLVGIFSYKDAGVITLVFWGRVKRGQIPHATHEALEVERFSRKTIPWKTLAFRSTTDALKKWMKISL